MTNFTISASGPEIARAAKKLLILPVAVIIVGAFLLAVAATLEDMRFARATQQLLGLVALAHDMAARQADFASQQGQDLFAQMAREGQLAIVDANGATVIVNPWQGAVHGTASAPSVLRIETHVPAQDCRRLALFFAAAAEIGLEGMEAKDDSGWRVFYKNRDSSPPDANAIEAACGQRKNADLALSFRLR